MTHHPHADPPAAEVLPTPPGRAAAWAVAAATAWAAVLLATAPITPMAWDEGNAVLRAEGIARWATRWSDAKDAAAAPRPLREARSPLDRDVIAEDWQYTTQLEGHPAVYGIVIAAGRWAAPHRLNPRDRARFGPMLLFAVAVGAVVYRLAREEAAMAAVSAAAAMLLLPRLFAHAHFASFDGPLVAFWLIVWAAFAAARSGIPAAAGWGVLLGLLLGCKATGWFAMVPLIVWTLLYRDRPAIRALAVGLPAAAAVFWLVNPPLWHAPLAGVVRFFALNFHRAAQPELNIATQFFGRLYNLDHPLPWYNTLVWTAVTVPLPVLGCFAVGLGRVVRRWRSEPAGILVALNWLVLVVVRALPGTPPHDAERLFLPSFAFLAILAGIGFRTLWDRLPPGVASGALSSGGAPPGGRRVLVRALLLVLVAGTGWNLVAFAPQWLSYYSLAIGGLRGATAAGMEPTYYWDALDDEVLGWLHAHTTDEEAIRFGSPSAENLLLMHRWGLLDRRFAAGASRALPPRRTADDVPFRWYVIQHRPSGWQPLDRLLLAHAEPAFQKTLRSGWGPWAVEVPLLSIFDHDDYLRARRAALRPPTP